jgi:hypothetical protein
VAQLGEQDDGGREGQPPNTALGVFAPPSPLSVLPEGRQRTAADRAQRGGAVSGASSRAAARVEGAAGAHEGGVVGGEGEGGEGGVGAGVASSREGVAVKFRSASDEQVCVCVCVCVCSRSTAVKYRSACVLCLPACLYVCPSSVPLSVCL